MPDNNILESFSRSYRTNFELIEFRCSAFSTRCNGNFICEAVRLWSGSDHRNKSGCFRFEVSRGGE